MEKLFYLCIFLLIAESSYALGPDYRDYLVVNQPMSYALIIKKESSLSTLMFNSKNNSNSTKINYHKLQFEFYPMLLSNGKKSYTTFSFGYNEEYLGESQDTQLAGNYSGAYLSFYSIAEINATWNWNTYFSYGAYSEEPVKHSTKSEKYLAHVNFSYMPDKWKSFKFGGLANSNFGNGQFLPVLGMSYSWGKVIADVLLPFYLDLRIIHHPNFHTLLTSSLSTSSHYDHNKKDALEISGINSGVQWEYKFYSYTWLQVGMYYTGEKELVWLSSDTIAGRIESGYSFSIGVIVRT